MSVIPRRCVLASVQLSLSLGCVLDIPLNLTTDASSVGDGSVSSTSDVEVASTTGDESTAGAATEPSSESGGESGEVACCAPLDAPTSTVAGLTADGAVVLPFGWYGVFAGGDCSARVNAFLYADPPPVELCNSNVGTYLEVTLYEDEWPDGFQGNGPVHVAVFMGLDLASTSGEMTILEFDQAPGPLVCEPGVALASEARFKFSLSVQGVDWAIEGDVSAAYCPECNVACP